MDMGYIYSRVDIGGLVDSCLVDASAIWRGSGARLESTSLQLFHFARRGKAKVTVNVVGSI